MTRFMKLTLLFSVPFGAAFFLIMASRFGLGEALGLGVGIGLAFGLIVACLASAMITYGERNPGKSRLRRDSRYVLGGGYDSAFETCIQSLDGLGRTFSVRTRDPAGGEIVANTGMNWKSFGERVTFRLRKTGDESTEVEVTSQPIVTMTRVDYGSNQQNIEAIGRTLTRHEQAA